MKRHRECRVYSHSDLFTAFEKANTRIISKFQDSTDNLVTEGVKYLQQMTAKYLGEQPNPITEYPTFQIPQSAFALERPELMSKRPILLDQQEQMHRGSTFNQRDQQSEDTCKFPPINQTSRRSIYESATANKAPDSSTKKLSKSFKKLGIDDQFRIEDDEDEEQNSNNINLPNFEGKSILQIMEESNKKIEARIKERQEQAEVQSDRSYPLTDHSSNDSSNDNDYQEEYRHSSFGKTESNLSSQTYKPSSILYSPKKSKSQAKEKKRLYIREKKIPRWAEDLQKVNEMVIAQKNDPLLQPNLTYGRCIAEQLNTNVIFNTDIRFYRGSSAKWSKNLYSQFIT